MINYCIFKWKQKRPLTAGGEGTSTNQGALRNAPTATAHFTSTSSVFNIDEDEDKEQMDEDDEEDEGELSGMEYDEDVNEERQDLLPDLLKIGGEDDAMEGENAELNEEENPNDRGNVRTANRSICNLCG